MIETSSGMRFGLFAVNYGTCADPDAAIEVAQHAESAGFDSVWTGEHVALPVRMWPGSSLPATLPFLDPLVALTAIARQTRTIGLGTGVVIAPLHNPVVLAKTLASVDVVSDGRLLIGVGAGYVAEEFAAVGVPLRERGARTDEFLAALRVLYAPGPPQFHGRFTTVTDIDAHPRPVQQPHPPFVIGGESDAALRRAVLHGNGWYGFNIDLAETRDCVARLRRFDERYERPAELGPLELTVTPREAPTPETVEQYLEAGVTRLVLLPDPYVDPAQRHRPVPLATIHENLDEVAGRLIASNGS